MKKKPPLSDEDRELWKRVSALIEPHKKTDAHRKKRTFKNDTHIPSPAAVKAIPKPAPKAAKKQWQSLTHQPAASTGKKSSASHELPAIADDIARQIKSKKRSIDARLDLHGMTQDAAHRKAISFVTTSATRQLKTILIITGKGSASSSDGVLQKNLPRWLHADTTAARYIAGISPAPRELGGSGAFVVQLRRRS